YIGYFVPFAGGRPHRKKPDGSHIEPEVHEAKVSIKRKSECNQSIVGFPIETDQQWNGNEFGECIQYFGQHAPQGTGKHPFGIHIQPTNIEKKVDWPKRAVTRLRYALRRLLPY